MMRQHLRTAVSVIASALLVAVACGVATGDGQVPSGQGRLALSLVDAPAPEVSAIVVRVTRVTAHSTTAGWVTISPATISPATPLTVDLLTLRAPATALALGFVHLPPGAVTQIRLVVAADGNYVVLRDGTTQVPLKVPSGSQSGVKIHGPWEIAACAETSVTLDFDGKKSIWVHPAQKGEEWILRPVIHASRAVTEPVGCGPGCDAEHPCPDGQVCSSAGECESAGPPGAPVGSECGAGADCLTLECQAGICAPGGGGAPCLTGSDCRSGACVEGSCTVPTGGVPAGGACVIDADCITTWCDEKTCARGDQGAPCGADTDCLDGLTCAAGTCAGSGEG